MNAFIVKRIMKDGEMEVFTVAHNENQAIKDLDLARYGRKHVKVRLATVEEIEDYLKTLQTVEIYEDTKKGEACINDQLIQECEQILRKMVG